MFWLSGLLTTILYTLTRPELVKGGDTDHGAGRQATGGESSGRATEKYRPHARLPHGSLGHLPDRDDDGDYERPPSDQNNSDTDIVGVYPGFIGIPRNIVPSSLPSPSRAMISLPIETVVSDIPHQGMDMINPVQYKHAPRQSVNHPPGLEFDHCAIIWDHEKFQYLQVPRDGLRRKSYDGRPGSSRSMERDSFGSLTLAASSTAHGQ